MLKITLDYNSDRIYINPDEEYKNIECEFNKTDMRDSLKFVETLLQEILNRMSDESLHVELEKLDEDRRITIAEW